MVDDSSLSSIMSHRSTEILFNMDFCWEFMVFLFAPLENSRQLHLSNKQTETDRKKSEETEQKKDLLGCLNIRWKSERKEKVVRYQCLRGGFFLSFIIFETVFFSSLSLLSSLSHRFITSSFHLIWVPDNRNMRKDTQDSHKHTLKRFYGL